MAQITVVLPYLSVITLIAMTLQDARINSGKTAGRLATGSMKVSKHLHKHALLFLCATFVLRALIPVGYMPAAWSDGLPFVLCPEGLPAAISNTLSGHDHHHGDSEQSPTSDAADQCNFAHIVSSAFLLHAEVPVKLTITGTHEPDAPEEFFGTATAIAYFPRGPPILKQG